MARRPVQRVRGDHRTGERVPVHRLHVDDERRRAGRNAGQQHGQERRPGRPAAAGEGMHGQTCRRSHSRTWILAVSTGWLVGCGDVFGSFMRSFRKRLLVLIIGLVIVTQTVTLAAVLASTRRTVEARSCGTAALRGRHRRSAGALPRRPAGERGRGAGRGLRLPRSGGQRPRAHDSLGARNNAQRIGADLVLVLDTRGQVLASTAPGTAAADGSLASLLDRTRRRARAAALSGIRRPCLSGVPGAGAHSGDHRLGTDGFRRRTTPWRSRSASSSARKCRSSRTLTTAPPASPPPWRRGGTMAARRARSPPPMTVSMSRASMPPST